MQFKLVSFNMNFGLMLILIFSIEPNNLIMINLHSHLHIS
jgi:hypothetical protein